MAYNNKNQKGKRNYKGSNPKARTQRKGKASKDKEYEAEDTHYLGTNDPAWYALNPQLLKDTASLPYSFPSGQVIPDVLMENGVQYTPGVCAIRVAPTPGYSADNTSAINVQARNIYSWVRHTNSGHANYDSPDLMMYLIAMDSMYTMWAFLVRIYGMARLYSVTNKYLPRALLAACGVDPDDVTTNLAQLRYYINNLSLKIGSLAVPASMPIFDRHMQLFSNIYKDSPTSKSQYYLFVPYCFYKWREAVEGPGFLKCIRDLPKCNDEDPGSHKLDYYIQLANDMADTLMGSEDVGIISGDIRKAFPSLRALPYLPDEYMVYPIDDAEIRTQIQNMYFVSNYSETAEQANTLQLDRGDIGQDPGAMSEKGTPILFKPSAAAVQFGLAPAKHLVTLPFDSPTPADTMVATRFVTFTKDITDKTNLAVIGSELAMSWCVGYFTNSNGNYSLKWTKDYTNDVGATVNNQDYLFDGIQILKFRGHFPIQIGVAWGENPMRRSDYCYDIDNFTTVDRTLMINMHNAACFSLWDVPVGGVTLR